MSLSRLDILRDRSKMFSQARAFFSSRSMTEVDCPLLTSGASVDAHIDLIPALYQGSTTRYLHSSPEYGMKRLISEGIGDCYQLAHVFRDGEFGFKHNPEFMMAEWYRMGMPFLKFIDETIDFIRLFLGNLPHSVISYRDALKKYAAIDPATATHAELLLALHHNQIPLYAGIESEGKDALLNLLLANLVEPRLGDGEFTVLAYYPASQAALAKTTMQDGYKVACRFEVYYQGVELANGYDELADHREQKMRLEEANAERLKLGKQSLPIDTAFLQALEKGLPSCCGVAVGFDRLMLLRHQAKSLKEVLPFDWESA